MKLKFLKTLKYDSCESTNKSCGNDFVCAEASCDGFVGFQVRKRENRTYSPLSVSARRIPQIRARGNRAITRAGFTMLELVFVIAITGIVAVAGGKAIVQILQNYTIQKLYAKTEMDSASLIRQISNYLQNSIWDSISQNKTTPISQVSNHSDGALGDDKLLYFIEKDLDTLNGAYNANTKSMLPYFAGFVDLTNSSGTTITTQSDGDTLANIKNGTALYFPFINVGTSVSVNDKYYESSPENNKAIFLINGKSADTLTLSIVPNQIGDVAMIVNAYPSYLRLIKTPGVIIDGKTYEKGDLVISRREPGENAYKTTTIAKKISNIHFWTESSSSLIRIRVCYEAGVTKSIMDEFCKEGIIMQ